MPDQSTAQSTAYLKHKIGHQPKWGFWLAVLWATFTSRRISEVLRLAGRTFAPCRVDGLEHLPAEGTFILAANHYVPTSLMRILTAILQGVQKRRPDVVDNMCIVAGRRKPKAAASWWQRFHRWLMDTLYSWWSNNLVCIDLDPESMSISGLREWRRRARMQPMLVLPEGKASTQMGSLRPGAGRMLKACASPVIPVAVWFEDGIWHVKFGPAVSWAKKAGVEDLQLGIAIASMLPGELACNWQPLLDRLEQRRQLRQQS